MASERYFWAALLWIVVGFTVFACRRRSPVFLPTLALIGTALNGSFYPVATTFVEASSWRNTSHLSEDILVGAQQQYIAFAVGLAVAAWLASQFSGREPHAPSHAERLHVASRDFVIACTLVVVGGALYAAYVQKVGINALTDHEDYAFKYLLSQGLGPLQLGLWMAIAGCLWAEASPLSRIEKNVFLVVAAGIAVWSIAVISVRTNFAILALGYLTILARRRGWQLRRVRPSLIVGMAALYLLLETFALLRGAYKGDFAQALWMIQGRGMESVSAAIGGSELSHPFITAAEVMADREPGELAGQSLLNGVLAFAPRGLYPDRPLMLSEQFVRANYVDLAARGGGAAFSLVAEGWLNFGSLLGPLVFGCAMGLLLFWVERRWSRSPHGFVARIAPYFAFYVAIEHRNEFATLSKQVFILTAVCAPVWILGRAAASVLTGRTLGSQTRTAES